MTKNVVVIGTQWGDEGKGKIVDWLTNHADAVVRFQGGHNAGHTLVIGQGSSQKEFKLKEIYSALENSKGVIVVDNILKDEYPMPINVKDKDEVFVGRIRRDFSFDKSLNLWIVADNLRKGAATNTVQIIESLLEKKIVK